MVTRRDYSRFMREGDSLTAGSLSSRFRLHGSSNVTDSNEGELCGMPHLSLLQKHIGIGPQGSNCIQTCFESCLHQYGLIM